MKALMCLIIGFGAVLSGIARADDVIRSVYYNKGSDIYRADADLTNEVLIRVSASFQGINSAANSLYWAKVGSPTIYKSTLAGVGDEIFSSNIAGIIDPYNEDIYIHQRATPAKILRHDVSTGQTATVISGPTDHFDPEKILFETGTLTVDGKNRYAYLSSQGARRIDIDQINQSSSDVVYLPTTSHVIAPDLTGRFIFSWINERPEVDDGPVIIYPEIQLERSDMEIREVVSSSFDSSGLKRVQSDGFGGNPIHFIPEPGTDNLYLYAQDLAGVYGLYKVNFFGGTPIKVSENISHVHFDVVDESEIIIDTEDPVVTLFSPTPGITNNQFISLAGEASDNTSVTGSVAWSLNGVAQNPMSVLSNGSFSASGITLQLGENILSITVNDLYGNQTTNDVTVTWLPDRQVSLGDPLNTSEGQLVSVPVNLFSGGDVSGMTVEIDYEASDLRPVAFDPAAALDSGAVTPNLNDPGTVTITFAKPGTTILSGDQLLGNLSFRARSVADELTTTLTMTILDVSDSNGIPIVIGNTATGTDITIGQREFTADVNTNGRLDIGDAFLMQRLLAGIEEKRSWDDPLNDLNGSTTLDSGDVVQVLRTVLGLLPQPEAPAPIFALSSRAIAEEPGPKATLVVDDVAPSAGDTITVRILIDDLASDIGGVSFTVDYPVEALQLEDPNSHLSGTLVSGGVLGLWNVTPSNDFANQTGTVSFAATGSSTWPGSMNGGDVGILKFKVTGDFTAQPTWPITLRNVELTNAGYNVDTPSGETLPIVGQPQTFQSWAATQFTAAELADLSVSGWTADPDSDGESNGQEYFQGSSALSGDGQTLSGAVYLSISGEEIPLIRLQHAIPHQAIDYQLQQSTNLDQWNNVDSQVYQRTLISNDTEDIFVGPTMMLGPAERIFLRLVFTNHDAQF